MKRVPPVAVAQTCAAAGSIAENIAEHLSLVRLAAAGGSRLIVFPELSLTGYEIELAPRLAFERRDARLAPLSDAARQWHVTLLVGAPVVTDEGLCIGTFVLRGDGGVGLYTKRRLGAFSEAARLDGTPPPPEATVFQPGQDDPLVAMGAHSAALAICADTGDPDHPARAAQRGASLYLASTFVIPSEYARDSARLGSYASSLGLIVVMSNHGAPTGGLAAAGRSAIWNPSGERLVQLPPCGSGIGIAAQTEDGWRTAVCMLDPDTRHGDADSERVESKEPSL